MKNKMTIQDLIDILQAIPEKDKTILVLNDESGQCYHPIIRKTFLYTNENETDFRDFPFKNNHRQVEVFIIN